MGKRNKLQQWLFTERNWSFFSEDPLLEDPELDLSSELLIKKPVSFDRSLGPRAHSRRPEPDLSKDLFRYISQLYQEYLNDFTLRVRDRLGSKHPYEQLHRYTLEVNKDFRSNLQKNILLSRDSYSDTELTDRFTLCVTRFVEGLKQELQFLKNYSRRLQIICCNEAYRIMKNASREIERILSPVFSGQELPCKAVNSRVFYDKIMSSFEELLEYAHDEETHDENLREFLQIEQSLLLKLTHSSSADSDGTLSDLDSSLYSELEDNKDEQLYQMDLDDLVTYINGQETPRKPKKRVLCTAKTRRELEMDREVELFKRRLDSWAPLDKKLQPSISQDYLTRLRARIRNSTK